MSTAPTEGVADDMHSFVSLTTTFGVDRSNGTSTGSRRRRFGTG
jgi:hypothetical protein